MDHVTTHLGRKIYSISDSGLFVVKFLWDRPGKPNNTFQSFALAKNFINKTIIGYYRGIPPLDEGPYTVRCVTEGCDNRPFKISLNELYLAGGILGCKYCGELCEVQDE